MTSTVYTLLSLLCGQRDREILTVINIKNICFEKDLLIICKASIKKLHTGESFIATMIRLFVQLKH